MRIASLVPSATEMLFALGLGGDVVGVTHECDFPAAAAVPEMIALAGGKDVIGRAGEKSPQVEWEQLAGLDPGVVVAMPCGYYLEDSRAQALEHRDRLASLGARHVFAVDAASTFSRPGPRLVDGVELLAHLFHPELAQPPAGIGFAELTL